MRGQMKKEAMIKTTITVSKTTWTQAKIAALRQGVTLMEYIAEALAAYNKRSGGG